MDLSKVFDCILHELLIAKMDAYVFSKTVTFPTWKEENKAFKLTTYIAFFKYSYLVFGKTQSSAWLSLIYS